ncbi:hypothetical protein yc1106_07044 [Curvularia clavata]|uniref:Uncharacterized protein n=1 Tax=Curvularia clavata TaxID=95742 RepID=A0A9Q8ZCM1_CURCL|nr:hypothetical protein yc1106_07044 [Curvularia clavata]
MPSKSLHDTYHPPPHPQLVPILICFVVMFLSALPTPSFLLASSTPLPQTAAKLLRWTQSFLFYFLYGAHGVETILFTKRLRDHGVTVGSGAWCKWMGTCFVGGMFCFEYFDRIVGRKA